MGNIYITSECSFESNSLHFLLSMQGVESRVLDWQAPCAALEPDDVVIIALISSSVIGWWRYFYHIIEGDLCYPAKTIALLPEGIPPTLFSRYEHIIPIAAGRCLDALSGMLLAALRRGRASKPRISRLNATEHVMICDILRSTDITVRAKFLGRAVKTLYSMRQRAIRRLGFASVSQWRRFCAGMSLGDLAYFGDDVGVRCLPQPWAE